jgi:hypothetical protein
MGNPRRDPQSLAQAEGGNPLVNSVVRAFSILRCFEHGRGHAEGRYLGNQDIARRTRLPKATVSRLTQTRCWGWATPTWPATTSSTSPSR